MRNSVVGFCHVNVGGGDGLLVVLFVADVVDDGGEGGDGVGLWAEGVLVDVENVVLKKMVHDLIVDDDVEDFADDGEK